MTVGELKQLLNNFPDEMPVMCESNQAPFEEGDTIFNAIDADRHDISTFGYEWSQDFVCRIMFDVL